MGRYIASACYRELGKELRKCREAAGLDSTELAKRLGWHLSKVSRIEAGRYNLRDVDLLHFLGPCGVFLKDAHGMLAICREAMLNLGYFIRPHEPGLSDTTCALVFHESTAEESVSYEPQAVPGLLQTENYVRSLFAEQGTDYDIDRAVEVRRERQRILHRPSPARFRFFVHENALRMEVGDAAVMHEQLLKMTIVGALPHVRIRVVLASVSSQAAFGGAFRLLRYAQHRPLVYLDNHFGGFFLEDNEFVGNYRNLLPAIADRALDAGQSREFLASLANEYDRGSAGDRVEEKQL
jgi:transcriptional regulator with XRE-family HTH domain